jgi:2',3'-cyclic-nucleotide 2'-phosphodiesterase (5'-nucleotidase family)
MRYVIFVCYFAATIWSVAALAADDKQVQQAVEQAKEAFEKAVAEQGGWMSTKKMIRSAELSATKGNKDKALELAEKARREAELSYQQAVDQKQHWSEPKYLK